MKNKILIFFFFLSVTICLAQQKVTWEDLSKVTYTDKYFPELDNTFLHPTFSESVKSLDGKQISITGYFLNINPRGNIYILSKGPMASCFFCGSGGPETAIELEFSTKQFYKTDTILTIIGVLKLNDSDIEHFNYILTECKSTVEN